MQGVSLAFLRTLIEREHIGPETTTADVVESFVIPYTKDRKRSFIEVLMDAPPKLRTDEKTGKSYFGDAHCMISHAWRCSFCTLVDCVASHISKLKAGPSVFPGTDEYYVLLDIFTINQHKMGNASDDKHIYDSLVNRLKRMVTEPSENTLILALDKWRKPTLLERAWCLFEIAVATREGVRVVGSLPGPEKHELYAEMTQRYESVEKHFTNIDVKHAKATIAADKAFILGVIRDLDLDSGNTLYEGFNALLRGVMRKWLATIHTHDLKIRPTRARRRVQLPFACAAAANAVEDSKKATERALDEIARNLGDAEPTVFVIRCTVAHDIEQIAKVARARFPKALLHGCTSSKGVMGGADAGAVMHTHALSIFCVSDPGGRYALASGDDCGDADAIECAVRKAKVSVDESASPDLCFSALSPGPGNEERVLGALHGVVGDRVVVFGGSSADDTLEGKWSQISGNSVTSQGFALLLMWPTVEIFVRLSSLHIPTDHSGVVTKVSHHQSNPETSDPARTILEIDGKPAASVYNAWTDGNILKELGGKVLEGNVLAASTNYPIGKRTEVGGGILLVHPAHCHGADGALDVFADVTVGDTLVCMNAETDRLVDSVGGVVQSALRLSRFDSTFGGKIYGCYVIYCGGMMLRVGSRIGDVAKSIADCVEFAETDCRSTPPWAGCFTFGEQGPVMCGGGSGGRRNVHGNLMMNILLFGRTRLSLDRIHVPRECPGGATATVGRVPCSTKVAGEG